MMISGVQPPPDCPAYRRALELAQTGPEQRFLADRLAEVTPSVPSRPGCAST
jgi:RNA polymerase sigma-70 factor, ECF subfamily